VAKARGKQISEVLPYKRPEETPDETPETDPVDEVTTVAETEADAGS